MKRKGLALLCAAVLSCGLLAACGSSDSSAAEETESAAAEEMESAEVTEESEEEPSAPAGDEEGEEPADGSDVSVRVGSLNGPTSIGLMQLMEASEAGASEGSYEFTIATAADELTTSLAKEELDVVLLPANTASTLYANTDGGVTVLDINTLSVQYIVSCDTSITDVTDLSGRTVCLPGKGTTPDYALQYLLAGYGVTDCTLEYKSESSEVVAVLTEDPEAIGLLPQPFVTVACSQNEDLAVVMDVKEQWDALQEDAGTGNTLVTGVTIVRTEFLEENPEAVSTFMEERVASADCANTETEHTAELVAEAGIVASADIAEQAIPQCNIVCIQGEEMKDLLSGYLEVLYGQNPDMVGGALPEDDFYYIP